MSECSCPSPGYCPVFAKHQSARHWQICRGEVLTLEKCEIYKANWRDSKNKHECVASALPGDQLKAIFQTIAVQKLNCSRCQEIRREMNILGVEGCRRERDRLLADLRQGYDGASISTKAKAAALALANGLPLSLDGLFDLAIERAASSSGHQGVS